MSHLADEVVGELDSGEAEGGLVHQDIDQALHHRHAANMYLIYLFRSSFASWVGFPVYPEIVYMITQLSCNAPRSCMWEMPDLNPKDPCPRNLVHYQ